MIDQRISLEIQARAKQMLSDRQRRDSSLYIDEESVPVGTVLGPTFQKIAVRQKNAVLVFVDDYPTASFSHKCHYLLFDAGTGRLTEELQASFPPYLRGWPRTYHWFSGWKAARPGGLRRIVDRSLHLMFGSLLDPPPAPETDLPVLEASGRKYAILFCGSPDPAHVNTMEFCYRILVTRFGFAPIDIHVLHYFGALTTSQWEGLPTLPEWPGNIPVFPGGNKAFQMPVSGKARRAEMQSVLAQLQPTANDLLFIHTTGHGNGEVGLGSYLVTHERQQDVQYFASDFGTDLKTLPQVRHLLVLMQQCCSGGFQNTVMQDGKADHIAFACPAGPFDWAYNTDDLQWNCFATDWFAAHQGLYPDNGDLVTPADTGPGERADGRVSAEEAYVYASQTGRPNLDDTPRADYSSPQAKLIGLDGQ